MQQRPVPPSLSASESCALRRKTDPGVQRLVLSQLDADAELLGEV